jgi:hypothetical protein
MVAWPLELAFAIETEAADEMKPIAVTRPVMEEVTVEDGPTRLAMTDELPFEIGEPTAKSWSMVDTVPVPDEGTPEVTPTEVRFAIDQNPK